MSYILEALRKAQAERARGAVPGVDAQPVPTIAEHTPVGRMVWAAAGLALLAVCAVLLWLRPGTGSEAGAPPVAAPAAQPAPPATPPASNISAVPDPAPPPARPARRMGEATPAETAAAPAYAPAPAPERIALLQDLPAQIQREIPPLAINGYLYASNPADRSVLINNRLRREGDQLADGLVLEKLLPREMVLNYRGYRYRVSY